VVFTQLFKNDIPNYGLYLLLGLVMWGMFSRATSMGTGSIVGRGGIVTKIYFPRAILPISSCITAFLMMLFEFTVFFAFLIVLQFIPPITILFLPILLVLEFVLVLSLALPLSVINVYYRDIQYIWNVVVHAGFFITPIFYLPEIWPENIRQILFLNPMAQLIDMAHDVALYNALPTINAMAYTVVVIFALLGIGYLIFRKYEGKLAQEL
jgi:lipopolysaccharide transport system permease protein